MDWFDVAKDQLREWRLHEKSARGFRKSFITVAQKALDAAFDEARSRDDRFIGCEHLLLGLLQTDDALLTKMFGDSGLTLHLLRSEMGTPPKGAPGILALSRLPFTPRMKHVLRNARLETEARGQSLVDERSLLLALLREKDGLPARLLRRLHIDAEALQTMVLSEGAGK
jgi:ATP-dependent Clp protease ATP-binding subunit ClpC